MKSEILRILCLLLCLSMIIPFASCAETEEVETQGEETEVSTEELPEIAKQNYGDEFKAVYCSDIFQKLN